MMTKVLLALGLLALPVLAQSPVEHPNDVCVLGNIKEAARVDGYVFRTYQSDDQSTCLEVIRNGKVIFRRINDHGGEFHLGQREDKQEHVPALANGTDITGRGLPNIIVSAYSGGAHCCLSHYVFELGPRFRVVAHLDAQDSWPAWFESADGGKHFDYHAEDWAFAYWPGSFAGSPHHTVVLRFVDDTKGGSYHLALDQMRKPVPDPKQWKKMLDEVRNESDLEDTNWANALASVLWTDVLDLLYSGHADLAWRFLDETRAQARSKEPFDPEGFCWRLKSSLYWPDLAPSVPRMPAACLRGMTRR